jgi:hypothetical protein
MDRAVVREGIENAPIDAADDLYRQKMHIIIASFRRTPLLSVLCASTPLWPDGTQNLR